MNTVASNWYGWFKNSVDSRSWADCEVRNFPDPFVAKQSEWLPHVKDIIKGREKDTVLVGHSSGALAAMRLSEELELRGVILVSAAHTDLGDENEKASGYFDKPWDWKAQVANTQHLIYQFHSDDDHLIPVAEARFVAARLNDEALALGKKDIVVYEELKGHSHFFEPFPRLLEIIDARFGPKEQSASEL